jgi:hypothetical protein
MHERDKNVKEGVRKKPKGLRRRSLGMTNTDRGAVEGASMKVEISEETAIVAVKHHLRRIKKSDDPVLMALSCLLSNDITEHLAGELYLAQNAR